MAKMLYYKLPNKLEEGKSVKKFSIELKSRTIIFESCFRKKFEKKKF